MVTNVQYLSQTSFYQGVRISDRPPDSNNKESISDSFATKLMEKSKAYENEADVVENRINSYDNDIADDQQSKKPTFHWYDGKYGYDAEVYRDEGTDSEYTVKLKFNDGRYEERHIDVDKVDASSCDFIELSVRMQHLQDEGKLDSKDVMMNLVVAHHKMEYSRPDADMSTNINFRSWYEQQLMLNMNNNASPRGLKGLLDLLKWL